MLDRRSVIFGLTAAAAMPVSASLAAPGTMPHRYPGTVLPAAALPDLTSVIHRTHALYTSYWLNGGDLRAHPSGRTSRPQLTAEEWEFHFNDALERELLVIRKDRAIRLTRRGWRTARLDVQHRPHVGYVVTHSFPEPPHTIRSVVHRRSRALLKSGSCPG